MTAPNCNFIAQEYLPINITKYSLRNPEFFDIGKVVRKYEFKNPFLRCMNDYNSLCSLNQEFSEFCWLVESAKTRIKKITFKYE